MDKIESLVNALPEIYQNIYGHNEFNGNTSRDCPERLELISEIVTQYQKYLGKKELKVLDIGCAQGFYSFALAAAGCSVRGIDFNQDNINLCCALQEENGLDCSFETAKITNDMVNEMEGYDVILFFSVVHHIANENGFKYARTLLETLASKSGILLTEMALKEEPLYWNRNLPDCYDEWFDNISFYDEQGFFGTHLSEVKRPLIFCSNEYCYYDSAFYSIDEYKNSAYKGRTADGNRRYYLCDNHKYLIKRFNNRIEKEIRDEIRREIEFTENNKDISFLPEPVSHGFEFGRVIEVTRIKYGKLLYELVKECEDYDKNRVFLNILDNCIELENKGFYHGDLRLWNVCVTYDKAFLIDVGSIRKDISDTIAGQLYEKYNETTADITVYDAYIALVYDCIIGNYYSSIDAVDQYHLSLWYDFDCIPEEYAEFIKEYLIIRKKSCNFSTIKQIYTDTIINKQKKENDVLEEQIILYEQLKRLNQKKADNLLLEVLRRDMEWYINSQIQECSRRIEEESRQIQNHSTRIEEQGTQIQNHSIRIEEQGSKIQELNTRLDKQYSPIGDYIAKAEEQSKQIIKLNKCIEYYKTESARTNAQIERLEKQVNNFSAEILHLKSQNELLFLELHNVKETVFFKCYRKLSKVFNNCKERFQKAEVSTENVSIEQSEQTDTQDLDELIAVRRNEFVNGLLNNCQNTEFHLQLYKSINEEADKLVTGNKSIKKVPVQKKEPESRKSETVSGNYYVNALKLMKMQDEDLVKALYYNILNREPDREGYAYNLQLLRDGTVNKYNLMEAFYNSKECNRNKLLLFRIVARLLYKNK